MSGADGASPSRLVIDAQNMLRQAGTCSCFFRLRSGQLVLCGQPRDSLHAHTGEQSVTDFVADRLEAACFWLDNHTPAWPCLMGRLRCPNGWLVRAAFRLYDRNKAAR